MEGKGGGVGGGHFAAVADGLGIRRLVAWALLGAMLPVFARPRMAVEEILRLVWRRHEREGGKDADSGDKRLVQKANRLRDFHIREWPGMKAEVL